MKTCNVLNEANGKQSVLHQELLKVLKNQEEADLAYARVVGPDFIEVFGDWVNNYKGKSPVKTGKTYPNGEPQLFKQQNSDQYYFELFDGTKEFIDKEGLRNEFSPKDIKEITGFFLYKYVENGRLKSLNEFEDNSSNAKSIMDIIDKAIADYKLEVSQTLTGEDAAEYLQKIALVEKYKEEFRNELIFSIKSLGEQVQEIPEEEKTEGLNIRESITVNPKSSATINTKILLSQIRNSRLSEFPNDVLGVPYDDGSYDLDAPDGTVLVENLPNKRAAIAKAIEISNTKEFDVVGENTGYLNTESFLSLNEVWETLQPLLSDIVTTGAGENVESAYSKMYAKIKELEPVKPWVADLLEKLDNMEKNNRNKLNEFVQAFSKTKINYYVTEHNPAKKEFKVMNATSTNSRESQILDSWGMQFKNLFLKGGSTRLTPESKLKIDDILKSIEEVVGEFNAGIQLAGQDNNLISEQFTKTAFDLFKELNRLGMYDVEPLDINGLILLNGGVDKQVQTMNDLFKGVRYMINGYIKTKDRSFLDNGEFANPFKTESILKKLAQSKGMRSLDISESSILANNNKNYFAYSNPTYVSNKIAEWIEDPTALENIAKDPYSSGSNWIKFLTGTEIVRKESDRQRISRLRLSKFKAGLASSFKTANKNDGVDNQRISLDDQIADNIYKLLGGRIKEKSYFPTIVAADKSRRIEFEGLPFFDSRIKGTKEDISVHSVSVNVLYGYFVDEYNRMKKVKRELNELDDSKKVVHYHTGRQNGLKSQLFPEFNHDNTDPKFEALRTALYNESGMPHTDDSYPGLSKEQETIVKGFIKESIAKKVAETAERLEKIDAIDKRLMKSYGDLISLSGDYVMNGIISNIEYTKMFSGDPAFYKNLPDLIKRVPATYTDGLQLAITNDDQLRFNIAVVNGVEVPSRYVDMIRDSVTDKSIADAYENVNTTDAQAWITPRRWKFLKEKLGQWSPKHDKVFEKMMSGKELRPDELKLAAQPLKGVYFEINNNVPTYLKYSQAVLIPSLVNGTPMQALYDKMTTNPETGERYSNEESHLETHEVITIDGVKVGALQPTSINVEGKVDMLEDFDLNVVELSNRGWKLQQDLPVKTMKETNLGSQIQKNILEGLQTDKNYLLAGEEIKGNILLQKIHDAVSELSNLGKEEVSERLGIKNGKITSKESLYNVLIDEFKSRGGNENIISALEKETPFDAIPQIRGRVDSVLMSIFNKALIKISTEGGSFIQVSPFGLETLVKDKVIDPLSVDEAQRLEELTAQKESLESNPTYIVLEQMPKITSASAKRETGGNVGTSRDINPSWLSNEGVSVEKAAEIIAGNNENLDESEVRDIIIDLLTKTRSEIMNDLFNEQEFKELTEKSKEEPTVEKGVNKSGIKIISENFNGEGLLPPRIVEGKVLPGQAMIPHSLAKKILSKNGYDINNITNEEWKKLFTQKAREIISYRIPNQGMSSNDTLEIVGILPAGMGDSIVGYDGIPAKTGSDFDIDKMFVMAPNLVFNKKTKQLEPLNDGNIQYFEKILEDEGAVSLNKQLSQNRVIELYQSVLQSPLTYDNMMTSIDSSFLKNDIESLFPAPKQDNLSFFSPVEQLVTKQNYMSGKMGVGLTANQLVDHVSNQTLDVRMAVNLGIVGSNGEVLLDKPRKGISIATTLSAFLNAYVDIAKDPYITRANHNDITANVTFMLVRSGVDIKYINRFIGQPILREYVELIKRRDSITGKPLIKNGKRLNPGEYLLEEHGFTRDLKAVKKLPNFSMENLESNIKSRSKEIDAVVLNAFLDFEKHALSFSDGVLAAKSDTKGTGGSPIEMSINRNRIDKVLDRGFLLNYHTKFENTQLGTYADNSLGWVSEVFDKSDLLISGKYSHSDMLNVMSQRLGNGPYMTNADLAKSVSNSFYSYLMSGAKLFKDNRSNFNESFKTLPARIQKLKDKMPDNFLIKELEISYRGGYEFLGINNKNKPVEFENDIYRAWLDLYRTEDMKDIAVELAQYAYTQSGFQPNLNQFFTYIPHEILKDFDLNSDVKGMFQKLDVNLSSEQFVEQFLRHNSDDPKIVKRVSMPEGATINDVVTGYVGKPMTKEDFMAGKEHPLFTTIKIGEVIALYKLVGVNEASEPMYIRTFKLGYTAGKNKVFEYAMDTDVRSSIIPDNNFSNSPSFKQNIIKRANEFKSKLKKSEEVIPVDNAYEETINTGISKPVQLALDFDEEAMEQNSTKLSLDMIKKNFEKIKKDKNIQDPDCKK